VEVTLTLASVQEAVEIRDASDVALVRRRVLTYASRAGLDEVRSGDVALVATEAASNVLKHAREGGVLLGLLCAGEARGVALGVYDRGPGMNLARCLEDGVSTAGTLGAGLGAITRRSTRWDAFSEPGSGTVITAEVWRDPPADALFSVGAVAVPYPGESVSGDAWSGHVTDDVLSILVVDGLGHGILASDAARAVIDAFSSNPGDAPAVILQRAHAAARPTRGAAGAVARIDSAAGSVTFAGVGNVAGWLWSEGSPRPMLAHHGTLGQAMPRVREETYPLPAGAHVVLHSDGIKSRWRLDYSELGARSPATIAMILWRDHSRPKDDCTAVVVRPRSAP
jgi:anti-sigma regulatory factor (Ser/Thr protein kinase)